MSKIIFTIGHSSHSTDKFISLLMDHRISALADVRSVPYSRTNPQYNREYLQQALTAAGIRYVFLGRELGARPDDPMCYVEGRVQYRLIAQTPAFREALQRLAEGSLRHSIALMCAEKDPLTCHRAILVSRALATIGIEPQHILSSGTIESHRSAVARLLREHGLDPNDLFRDPEQTIAMAYEQRESQIAFTKQTLLHGPAHR